MMSLHILPLITVLPVLLEAQQFSSANERMISHMEHELAESDIIQLPVQNFPEPQCEYSMHEFHKDGRRIVTYVFFLRLSLLHFRKTER